MQVLWRGTEVPHSASEPNFHTRTEKVFGALVLWVSMIHVFFEVRTCFSGGKTAGRTGWRWRKRRRLHADLVRLKEVRGTCRSEIGTRMMIQRHMICLLEHDSRQVKSRCPMKRNVFRWRFLFIWLPYGRDFTSKPRLLSSASKSSLLNLTSLPR